MGFCLFILVHLPWCLAIQEHPLEEALQSQDDESSHEPGHSPQASGQAARAATPATSFALQFLGFVAAQAQS